MRIQQNIAIQSCLVSTLDRSERSTKSTSCRLQPPHTVHAMTWFSLKPKMDKRCWEEKQKRSPQTKEPNEKSNQSRAQDNAMISPRMMLLGTGVQAPYSECNCFAKVMGANSNSNIQIEQVTTSFTWLAKHSTSGSIDWWDSTMDSITNRPRSSSSGAH